MSSIPHHNPLLSSVPDSTPLLTSTTHPSSLLNPPAHNHPTISLFSIFSPQPPTPFEQKICTRALGHTHYMTCTVYVSKQNDLNLNDIIGLRLNAFTHGFVSCLSFHVAFGNIPLVIVHWSILIFWFVQHFAIGI